MSRSEAGHNGWKLVPIEPTREMLIAAGATPDGVTPRGGLDYLGRNLPRYWQAMLSASPAPPVELREGWRDISSAPKIDGAPSYDQPRIRLWDGECERHGRWCADEYSKKPRPYWSYDGQSTTDSRGNQPTHWMPLPSPPVAQSKPTGGADA